MTSFEDQFSKQSDRYKKFRPSYPDTLFEYLVSLCSSQEKAWDCATGNGQAAAKLVKYFDHVVATDASETQIENALQLEAVEFKVAPAEASGLNEASIDLITVANALHWFDQEKFFQEAERVLKTGGILAFWCYEAFQTEEQYQPAFTPIYDAISGHWSPKLNHVRSHYSNIDIPMPEIKAPKMKMELQWNLHQCLGFLSSWSACQNYLNANGKDPTREHFEHASKIWGEPEKSHTVSWNLHLRIAQKPAS